MNLADLTTYVTTKSQLVEPDDQAACQLFLSKRYELIYNSYLWKDSLGMVNVAMNPASNLDNAAGIVMLPQEIDRLVAIRTNNGSVRIQGLEHFYRIDWDAFCNNEASTFGYAPREMAILNPVWLTVRPTANFLNLTAVAVNYGYADYRVNDTTVISIIRAAGALPEDVTVVTGSVYVIIPGPNETGFFNPYPGDDGYPAGLIPLVNGTPVILTAASTALRILGRASGLPFSGKIYLINGQNKNQSGGAGSSLAITSDNAADVTGSNAIKVKVTWRDQTDRYTITSGLPITLTPADNSGYFEIESVFKPVSAGNLTLTTTSPYGGMNFTQVVGSLPPPCTKSPSYQRVRVFPIPTGPVTLNVLGKKPFTPLTFPTEIPAIRNLDNCLIAYGMGDMLERSRQFGKANAQYQEATLLLAELAKLETLQAANNIQFIPQGGYGDRFFGPGQNGFYGGEY